MPRPWSGGDPSRAHCSPDRLATGGLMLQTCSPGTLRQWAVGGLWPESAIVQSGSGHGSVRIGSRVGADRVTSAVGYSGSVRCDAGG